MLKNKKGFTLIEIVIVIVIIAILAAMLVPSLTGWIDKAKIAVIKSEADTVKNAVAAQVVDANNGGMDTKGTIQTDFNDEFYEKVSESANTTIQCSDPEAPGYVEFSVDTIGIITFLYSTGEHVATYDGSTWSYE